MYQFKYNLCDAEYVGYTRGFLHERVDGHKRKASSITHQATRITQFHVPAKCKNNFDCLVKEILFIFKLVPD